MALSSVSYPGDGSNTLFAVNIPYLSKAHVKVYIDGVEDTAFTWLTSSSINTSTVAAIGEIVLIKRTTPSTPLVDFVDGSTLTEELLDTATVQSLYVAEESSDSLTELILLDLGDNKFDGNDKVIKNVANPVNPQDVASKVYVDSTTSASAAAAALSASASEDSAEDALVSANAAALSATNASNSASAAALSAAMAISSPVAAPTHAAVAKPTPVDSDEFPLIDSAISFGLKKFTWSNIKAALKSYFDGIYSPLSNTVAIRQTVLSGAVDTNGLPSFGGATGTNTVTASTTLTVTAANGMTNRTGSITNPAWGGLTINGIYYLSLDIDSAGVCTPSYSLLAPTYRWGGADVVTNNQFTFNIQEMQGKVGNGAVATQTYRVFVGEVLVAAGVVSTITWYALMGRYDSGFTATLPAVSTTVLKNHNLGVYPELVSFVAENTTTEFNYSVGDRTQLFQVHNLADQLAMPPPLSRTNKTVRITSGSTGSGWCASNNTTGAYSGGSLTAANWKWKTICSRGW
jgi:hypothetical protein